MPPSSATGASVAGSTPAAAGAPCCGSVSAGGWHAVGTEVAPVAVEQLRAQGFDVRLRETGGLELDLGDGSYDVISMVEVIEHVCDPDALLSDSARLLRPGGALYITTPHGRSLSARTLGMRWSTVAPSDHLQLFCVRGLRAALARSGLVVRSTSTHGVNPYEIVAGLRAGRKRAPTAGNTETSYCLTGAMSTRRAGALAKVAVHGVLSATRLGDTMKVVAERPGAGR